MFSAKEIVVCQVHSKITLPLGSHHQLHSLLNNQIKRNTFKYSEWEGGGCSPSLWDPGKLSPPSGPFHLLSLFSPSPPFPLSISLPLPLFFLIFLSLFFSSICFLSPSFPHYSFCTRISGTAVLGSPDRGSLFFFCLWPTIDQFFNSLSFSILISLFFVFCPR